jgi:hypothetical protein
MFGCNLANPPRHLQQLLRLFRLPCAVNCRVPLSLPITADSTWSPKPPIHSLEQSVPTNINTQHVETSLHSFATSPIDKPARLAQPPLLFETARGFTPGKPISIQFASNTTYQLQ